MIYGYSPLFWYLYARAKAQANLSHTPALKHGLINRIFIIKGFCSRKNPSLILED